MTIGKWIKEFNGGITVCDRQGIIIEMNEKAGKTFTKDGGTSLIGKSLLECHPEPARTKLLQMLESGATNSYTIEKNGVKKLIHQAPWHENGQYMGLVELSIEIPMEMAHFVRKSQ